MSAVYTAERDGLVRMAAFVTGDVGAADELVQDAFADLYEAWPGVQTPTAWLRRAVTRRACRGHVVGSSPGGISRT